MTVLETRALSKRFGGVHAVRDVSFSVPAGEMLALIGPNGAGKSTCFNLVNGQLAADHGEVVLCGKAITGRLPREIFRLGVGRTFQIPACFASMPVIESVQAALISRDRMTFRFWRPATAYNLAEALELVNAIGMGAQTDRNCGVLAYGDIKRVELALALANQPRLLLMDEPTAGMAPGERRALMGLTQAIARQRGIAVLFTEHDMDAVFEFADRIIVMDRGEVIAEGDPAAIRRNAKVQDVYLGSGAMFGAARD